MVTTASSVSVAVAPEESTAVAVTMSVCDAPVGDSQVVAPLTRALREFCWCISATDPSRRSVRQEASSFGTRL